MLSKLFEHIRIGSGLWLWVFIAVVVASHYTLFQIFPSTSGFLPVGLQFVLAGFLLAGVVFALVDLGNTAFLTSRKNLYAGVFLALLWGCVPGAFTVANALLPFLLMAIYYNLYQISERIDTKMFPYLMNAGALAFMASMISPVGSWFLLLIFAHSVIQSKATFREIFIPLYTYGFCAAIFWAAGFLFDETDFLPWVLYRNIYAWHWDLNIVMENRFVLGLFFLLFILSLRQYFTAMSKGAIVKRKAMSLFVVSFLFFMGASLFQGRFMNEYVLCATIPLAVLFSNHVQYLSKYWMRELWIWGLLALNILLMFI